MCIMCIISSLGNVIILLLTKLGASGCDAILIVTPRQKRCHQTISLWRTMLRKLENGHTRCSK